MTEQIPIKQLAKLMKKMRIDKNTLVAIKSGTALAEMGTLADIKFIIEKLKLQKIAFIVVDNLDDIRTFPEADLQRAGYFRASFMQRLTDKRETNVPSLHPPMSTPEPQ